MANAIHLLMPYRHASTWVFDDPRVGLSQEPFVSGILEMIDAMVPEIPTPKRASGSYSQQRRFRANKSSWRRCKQNMRAYAEGWRCPALFSLLSRSAGSALRQGRGSIALNKTGPRHAL
jgi:hypothetical protein